MAFLKWTPELKQKLEILVRRRESYERIANILGFSKSGIACEVQSNGGKYNYSAQQSIAKRAEREKRIGGRAMTTTYSKTSPKVLKEQIDNLQEQINIILDVLKDIKK